MKIIKIDLYNRKSVFDILVATNVSNYYANVIAQMLNRILGDISPTDLYRAVEDDYKLQDKQDEAL